MAICVEWENKEKTVLRMAYENDWNWRDHRIALDVVRTLMGTSSHPVDLFVDLNNSHTIPADSAHTSEAVHATQRPFPSNWSGRAVVLSGDATLAQAILEALPQADLSPAPC